MLQDAMIAQMWNSGRQNDTNEKPVSDAIEPVEQHPRWPLYMIIAGCVLSMAWTALLAWAAYQMVGWLS